MKKKSIDILCLQETWMNTNSQEQVDGYNFVFSTSVENKDIEERIKKQEATYLECKFVMRKMLVGC